MHCELCWVLAQFQQQKWKKVTVEFNLPKAEGCTLMDPCNSFFFPKLRLLLIYLFIFTAAWITDKDVSNNFPRSPVSLENRNCFGSNFCLASVLGNVLVVYVVNKYSVMQTITNILIRNLALTDIIMATLIMPFWITNLYSGKWNLSQEWCEVSSSAQFIMALASLFIMGLIALNRYMKVVKPSLYIKFFPSKRVAWLYFGLVWAVSVLVATPPLYGWGKINFDSHFLLCSFNWKEGHFSFVILLVGLFDVTMVAIFYSYWKIYQTVKESTGNVNANVAQNGVGAPRFHRTDIDVLKTCLTVVCFFLITWFPIALCAFIIAGGGYIPGEVTKVTVYLMFSNSVVNPIIYGIMNPQFKQAFKKAFRCGRYGNGNEEQSHARAASVIIYPRSN